METIPVQDVSLNGQVLFYQKPELLSKELHAKLGVNPPTARFGFAAKAHFCPLTVPEFGPASLSYPIIFVGSDYAPVAVMGLQEGQNLYTTERDGFDLDVYIPAYIRRYPFVLAGAETDAATGEQKLLVGIDRGYEYITENSDFPFFENGEPSAYTQRCIQFCSDFETQHQMTLSFVAMLKELDLLEPRTATYTPSNPDGTQAGEPQTIAQFFGVSEARLAALPDAKFIEMKNNGALQQIYAHLNSLIGWERLIMRAMARVNQLPVAANG